MMRPHKEQETFFLWLSRLFGTRNGNQSRVKAGRRVEEGGGGGGSGGGAAAGGDSGMHGGQLQR